jgi:uncharacterized protein (TIGR02246 family)
MPTTTTAAKEDAGMHAHIDALAQAIRAKDLDALMPHYAPDMTVFDVRPPLQRKGREAYRENFEAWFASVEGPIEYEMRDLQISASGDLGICHLLGHVRSMRKNGRKADYWVRVTSGLRKEKGRWLVTHEHVSLPIHMETMQAALDAKP